MPNQERRPLRIDELSLIVGLGGVLVATFIAALGRYSHQNFTLLAFAVFASAQIAGIVMGVMAWHSSLGRTGAITSTILLACSLLLIT